MLFPSHETRRTMCFRESHVLVDLFFFFFLFVSPFHKGVATERCFRREKGCTTLEICQQLYVCNRTYTYFLSTHFQRNEIEAERVSGHFRGKYTGVACLHF